MHRTRFPLAGLLAVTLLAACSDSGSMTASGTGRVRLVMGGAQAATTAVAADTLSDGTGRTIASAEIELSSVEARNLDGELIDVSVDLPMTVDLVGLVQGHTVELP